jgi:hypothetical protein
MHENRMQEAFSLEVAKKKHGAAVDDVEKFQVDRIHQLKTALYLQQGLAFACSSGRNQEVDRLIRGYHVFFNPSSKDITCKYQASKNGIANRSCFANIDSVSCTDMNTMLLPSRSGLADNTQISTVRTADDPSDCKLFIDIGIYKFSKTTLTTFAGFWPSSHRRQLLIMPRDDASTRFFMMLKPNYVCVGNSQVYYVHWGSWTGRDAWYYTSWDKLRPNVVLTLVPVSGAIDNRRLPIDIVASNGWSREMIKYRKTPVTAPVPKDRTVEMVVYFPQFQQMNETMLRSPSSVMNVRMVLNQKRVERILRPDNLVALGASWQPGWKYVFVWANNGANQWRIPALLNGACSVNLSNDIVTMCVSSESATVVYRATMRAPMKPFVMGPEYFREAKDGYSNACMINAAEYATNESSIMDVPAKLESWDLPILRQNEVLLPGQQLVSNNKNLVCRLGYDGNLKVITRTGMQRWTAGVQGARKGGSLTLIGSAIQMDDESGRTYWVSSLKHPVDEMALAPFFLILSDSGDLQVRSYKSGVPVWSSGSSDGFIIEGSFKDASDRYMTMHNAEIKRDHKDMNPWTHYQQYGRIKGYYWPGPQYN